MRKLTEKIRFPSALSLCQGHPVAAEQFAGSEPVVSAAATENRTQRLSPADQHQEDR